ncbi:MAG TPA: hypothetical protein DCW68_02925 [Rhodospirillaceae bacterium]|nr:MAG: hypothetical protein A2018_05900 [Alphaproteobacteria bacterium GWF2_58_20]HAU29045.1 hypothetical protein [Rhodospirillaceae bacterium]
MKNIQITFPEKHQPWEQIFPMSQDELCVLLGDEMPEKTALHLDLREKDKVCLALTTPSSSGSEPDIYFTSTLSSGNQPEGLIITVKVAPHLQGKGIARRALANLVSLGKTMGISRFSLSATLENGGYAWARFGFMPDPGSWDFLRTSFLHPRLELFSEAMPPHVRAQVETAIASNDPSAIFALAAIRASSEPLSLGKILCSGQDWNPDGETVPTPQQWEAMKPKIRKRMECFSLLLPLEDTQEIYALLKARSPEAALGIARKTLPSFPIGRLMLAGTSWTGSLDLENPVQAAIFNAATKKAEPSPMQPPSPRHTGLTPF